MTKYIDLVNDVRLHGPANRTQFDQMAIARAIHQTLVALVAEVAELSPTWPLLPRETVQITDLSSLATGLPVETDRPLTRLAYVGWENAQQVRGNVTIVRARNRHSLDALDIGPLPWAFLADAKLFPIPQPGTTWTDDSIRRNGWSQVRKLIVEVITLLPAPGNVQDDVTAHVQFHQPAVLKVANRLFPSPDTRIQVEHEVRHLRGQAGRGAITAIQHIGDVYNG